MSDEPADIKAAFSDAFGEDNFDVEKLHPDLRPYIEEGGVFGRVLKHPLVFQCPFFSWKMANRGFEAKKAWLAKCLAAGNYYGALYTYERPYRISTLIEWWDDSEISEETKKDLLMSMWRDTEFPSAQFSLTILVRMFRSLGFVSDNESAKPTESVVVYRGVAGSEFKKGISWTSDLKVAQKFAARYSAGKNGIVYSAKIDPDGILAILHGRGESEVVVDPVFLRELRRQK